MIKTQLYLCLLTHSHCIQYVLTTLMAIVGRKHTRILAKGTYYLHMCVCLSSSISSVPPRWIFVNFYVMDFYENLSKKSTFH
jgi:purine-cytosine permease-like protein